jgi:protein-tyrosine-phosphatase
LLSQYLLSYYCDVTRVAHTPNGSPPPPADLLGQRAAAHAALGEPVRLAIIDRLVESDSTPSELGRAFDLTSNLLAHHLGVLERAGLIERVISSGDRRRRYLRIRCEISGLLSLGDRRCASPALFVCTHNSARSQLAAALWQDRTGMRATSAGTHPAARVHRGARRAAQRRGLDLGDAVPRGLDGDELDTAPLVITVCDRAHEEIALPSGALHWSIPDPVQIGTAAAFDAAADHIDQRIERFARPRPI